MKSHLKRVAVPKSWPIMKKVSVFITRPEPGAHSLEVAMPINVLLKEVLNTGIHTTKEAKKVIDAKRISVDSKPITSHRRGVGFMDIINIPELKENYRLVLNTKGKLHPIKIDDEQQKALKITRKSATKGGKVQITLSDGRNIEAAKDYKVGDTVVIELPSQKVKKHIPLKAGVQVYLTGGKHVGKVGTLKAIAQKQVTFALDGEDIITSRAYAMAIGDKQPEVKIHE